MRKKLTQSLVFLLLIVAAAYSTSANANARPEMVAFYFRAGSAAFDQSYADNSRAFNQLKRIFVTDTERPIKRLVVVGGASPEGGYVDNLYLARLRTQNIVDLMKGRFPWIFTGGALPIKVETVISKPLDQREESYEIGNMRYVAVYVHYDEQPASQESAPLIPVNTEDPTNTVPTLDRVTASPTAPPTAPEKERPARTIFNSSAGIIDYSTKLERKPLFALKTNLLFDAASMLNAELEIPIGPRWSLAAEWVFPWWLWNSEQYCLQMMSGTVEARCWFGDRTDRKQLTGWFLGAYASGGLYDLEWKGTGVQGEFFVAAGLSAGFAHTLDKRGTWRMEYGLGVGYLQTNYRQYKAEFGLDNEWHLIHQQSGTYTWIGPTRAKISLVFMIHHGYAKKRGGSR